MRLILLKLSVNVARLKMQCAATNKRCFRAHCLLPNLLIGAWRRLSLLMQPPVSQHSFVQQCLPSLPKRNEKKRINTMNNSPLFPTTMRRESFADGLVVRVDERGSGR